MTTPAIELVDGLPLFSSIEPAQIKPAIEKAIAKCKLEIDEVVASKDYSYANLVLRLGKETLCRYSSEVKRTVIYIFK